MHDDGVQLELRIERLLRERILPAVERAQQPLDLAWWHAPGEPVPFAEAVAAAYTPVEAGAPWGRPWGTTWIRARGAVPVAWRGADGALPRGTRAELVVDLGFTAAQPGFQAEGLCYRPDGSIVQGIAPRHPRLPAAVGRDGTIDVLIEAAANPDIGSDWQFRPTPLGDLATAGDDPLYVLRRVDVALVDRMVWDLVQDVRALTGLASVLPRGEARRARILGALEDMADALDPGDIAGTADAARAALAPALASPANASAHTLHAVGHAHIDSAWLWPIRETVRKCARTFSNVLALMDEDPGVTFACSSAQQFAWMKAFYPALFARISDRVREGRFVPVGGMWVESDTNMPGAEALVRQFVAGQSFFEREFGLHCDEVWLPDSFGYSAALPGIVRGAGARWFFTQKLSWNETNTMPHHTFQWEGIDGTRVFTHFPPADTYNSTVSAEELHHAATTFRDARRASMSLLPYGYGDGGGGPTAEMAAAVARTTSLEGSPRVVHSTPTAFFEAAEAEYADPPVWTGELYLELHRGTYTSQLGTKQGNRRSELLLREAELWATTAAVRTGAHYPHDELDEIWRSVLLHQFHDILPGSAIAWVAQDAVRTYEALAERLEALIARSLDTLAGQGDRWLVVNAAPHARAGIAAMSAGHRAAQEPAQTVTAVGDTVVLENGHLRAVLDDRGLLVSLIHRATGRESIPPHRPGNLLQLIRDTPVQWDAWDVDRQDRGHVVDLVAAESMTIGDDGCSVRVERRTGATSIVETVRLSADGRGLDLRFDIDWHERQQLLKLAFPIDVHAASFASEIQFGHVDRATHANTSWDVARFETCAHRWIRVAEGEFGVAVLNDSTYGHDVSRQQREGGGTITVARLSLLRSALFPDPEQDQGAHTLTVQVRPGASVADTVAAGYHLGLAERIVRGARPIEPLVASSHPGLVVEAVKLAEDRSGDVIVRLYESLGTRYSGQVRAGFAAGAVEATDLLERPLESDATVQAGADARAVTLRLRPFQIVTLRYRR